MEDTLIDQQPEATIKSRARGLLFLALAFVVALLAAACSDGSVASDDSASIRVTDPADGASVEREFTVTLDPSVPIGEPDTGLNHVHLYYDGNRSENEADYDIAYTESFTVTRLGPGEHTIEAVIADADHSVTDVAAEIAVTVGDTGSRDEPETTTTDGFDY